MSKENLKSVPQTLKEIKAGGHKELLERVERVLGVPKEEIIKSMERTVESLNKDKKGKK